MSLLKNFLPSALCATLIFSGLPQVALATTINNNSGDTTVAAVDTSITAEADNSSGTEADDTGSVTTADKQNGSNNGSGKEVGADGASGDTTGADGTGSGDGAGASGASSGDGASTGGTGSGDDTSTGGTSGDTTGADGSKSNNDAASNNGQVSSDNKNTDVVNGNSDGGSKIKDGNKAAGNQKSDTANSGESNNKDAAPSDTALNTLSNVNAPITAGTYIIMPAISQNRVLDIAAASASNGASVLIWQSNMYKNQYFVLEPNAQGYYTIKAAHSGKVIDVSGSRKTPGTKLVQWEKHSQGAPNQLWKIVKNAEDGTVSFISALSTNDTELALDIQGGLDIDGMQALIWKRNNAANQRFYLIDPYSSAMPTSDYSIANGVYSIGAASGTNLDIQAMSLSDGASLLAWHHNSAPNQMFVIMRDADGYYSIRPLHSARYLDVNKSNRVAGTPIIQWSSTNGDNQRWALKSNGDGTVQILSKSAGLAMTCSTAGTASVLAVPNSGEPAQRFSFTAADTYGLPASYTSGMVNIIPAGNSGLRVDVTANSYNSGAAAILYGSTGGHNQKFEIIDVGNKVYGIRAAHSGRYIGDENGHIVQTGIGPAVPTNNSQLWTAQAAPGGYVFINIASNKMLSTNGNALASVNLPAAANNLGSNGTPNNAWAWAKSAQIFRLSETFITYDGYYRLNTPNNMRLDFAQNGANNGSAVYLWSKHDGENQKFSVHTRGGAITIQGARYQKSLDIRGGSSNDGAEAITWNFTANKNQQFYILPSGDGWFILKAAYGPYIAAGSDTSGARVVITNNRANAQRFRFEATDFRPYSGTWVDVNITTQRLLFVRDGFPLVDCDIVTGKRGFDTPTGIFRVLGMSRNVNLVGSDYNVWSDYWMPFTSRGHGLHDAYRWRSVYGGSEYIKNGSHGCVNMQLDDARKLYENCYIGLTVSIHY
ncbi:MAG: RICIN domain-containing protein [Coriobacteriales bacterium]|jgi:hypothetical protein|nr:RICIN domain-containing protein [Coriobacteriales bacterium]